MSLIDNKVFESVEGGLITVRRDNVLLDIPVEQKSYYMGLGYNVVDKMGNVLEETTPTDIGTLQRFFKDAKAEIAKLKDENASLREEIKSLKATAKKTKVKEPEPIEEAVEEQPAATTRRRRRS